MDRLVYYNDSIVDVADTRLPVTTAGVLYGWGVFTTLRIYNGKLFAFEKHWDRLVKHAERVGVPVPLDIQSAQAAAEETVTRNAVKSGRARITLLRGRAGGWSSGAARDSELLIFTSADALSNEKTNRPRAKKPVSLTISPHRAPSHGPTAGIKRTSMIENLMALEEARSRGFTEAVMVNERGEIVGATAANLFWTEGDQIFTPSLGTGCIAGVTRGLIIEIAHRQQIAVTEGGFPVQRLLDAGEVFLTSTTGEIAPAGSFDIKEYRVRYPRITKLLSGEFQKLIRSATITR
jgi:branched-chain amino acid aminotransferase